MGCGPSNGDNNGSELTPTQAKRLLSIAAELGMTNQDVKKFHKCFRRCHINQNDKVDIETFATQNTVYPEVLATVARLVSTVDELTFEEFFVCMYNLITQPTSELATLVFQCFDVDDVSGALTEDEIMQLVSVLWKLPPDIVLEALKERTWNGPLLLGTFLEICAQFPRMMMPVIDMQNIMIQNTVGHKRARILSEHRAKIFAAKSMVHIVHELKVKPSCYAKMMTKVRKNDTLQPKQRPTQSNVPDHIRDQGYSNPITNTNTNSYSAITLTLPSRTLT